MYLLYADESGNVADPHQKHFVLAGISVFEKHGHYLAAELDKIAGRFNPSNPESIELHGNPMRIGKGYWSNVPKGSRIDAIKDALSCFAKSNKENRIFACVLLKSISPKDAVEYSFEQISSRFDMYLMRLYQNNNPQKGIIIFDKSTYERPLQVLARDFRTFGHRWGILRNFAEVPLFLDSKASRLIQLADLIAYAIFRNFEFLDSQFYNIIQNRFDAHGSSIHGLHIKIS